MHVLVVIVNYRTAPLAITAARSIADEVRALGDSRITIVENASGDGSRSELERAVAEPPLAGIADVLVSETNGGFGAGNNLGIRHAEGTPDHVYLVNPDAQPDPGAIASLLRYMGEHPEVGIAGSAIHGGDGRIRSTAFRYPTILSELERGLKLGLATRLLGAHRATMPVPHDARPVDWVSGASMMLRGSMLDRVGLFDEGFFLYFEETDLCRRARRDGWQVHYVPESTVAHIGAVATGLKDRSRRVPTYWLDSRRRYFRKHHGRLYLLAADLAWGVAFASWRLRRRLQSKPDHDPPHALSDFVRHALGFRARD